MKVSRTSDHITGEIMSTTERYCQAASHPRGTVLIFTLVILLLMAMMGTAIMLNTRTELSISYNTNVGRDAFNRADMTARIATLMGRVLLHPELGEPKAIFDGASGGGDSALTVELDRNWFNKAAFREKAMDDYDAMERYLLTSRFLEGSSGDEFSKDTPQLVFRQKSGEIISTAALSMDYGDVVQPGMSLDSGNAYDPSGGSSVRVVLLVTVSGHPPVANKADNAYSGGNSDLPYSVITTIFREII